MHIFGREENNGRDFLIIQPAETPSPTSQAMSTTYMGTVSLQSPRPLESLRFASSEPLADLAYAAKFRSETPRTRTHFYSRILNLNYL